MSRYLHCGAFCCHSYTIFLRDDEMGYLKSRVQVDKILSRAMVEDLECMLYIICFDV